jgi:hypothetical protein
MNKNFMNNYSASVKQALDKYGNDIINTIMIVRTPLAESVSKIIDIALMGKSNKLKKKEDYDNLFHLNILINGKYTLEKNEIINFVKEDTRTSASETMVVSPIPNDLSINMLLSNTKKQQGAKYYRYSASSNNCQDFQKSVFQSNNMNDSRYIEFIKQDTESIFKGNSYLRQIANNATDAAAIGNLAYSKVTTDVNSAVKSVKKGAKQTARKIQKVFGGSDITSTPDIKKMKVAELKGIIKAHKKYYNRKVTVTGLNKKQLVSLVEELY